MPVKPPSAQAAGPPVLALDHVHKQFDASPAVADAHFDVARGEFFSILGPSGCGKTTLLRLIGGFETPSAGVIRIDGRDVAAVPAHRRQVNTVFQNYALFPHLSVFDNIAFGPRAQSVAAAEVERRVHDILATVELVDLAERRPEQLSGGQRQRVALARALVNRPSALLLDEPLSALDLRLRQAMRVELKRIQRQTGVAFVLVTHDQDEALMLSDRIAVMNRARIEQIGSPREIYHRPASLFVAQFIGSANLLSARVDDIADGVASLRLAGASRGRVTIDGGEWRPGEAARLMLRPERVQLHASAPDGTTCIVGTLVDATFQGPFWRCVVRTESGDEVIAHLDCDRAPSSLEIGQLVYASWRSEDARLLREPGTGGG